MSEPAQDPEVQAVLAEAGVQPEVQGQAGHVQDDPASDPQPTQQPDAPQVATGKVMVKWGDTTREVDIEELVEARRNAEQTQDLRKQAEDMLGTNAAYSAFGKQLQSMSPQQQQQFQRLLQDPSLLDRREPQTTEDSIDAMLEEPNGHSPEPSGDPRVQRQLEQLTKVVEVLAQREQGRDQQQQKQTLGETVDKTMGQFSVFGDKQAASFAKRSVMAHLASDPNANVEHLVASHAEDADKMLQSARRGAVETVNPNRGSSLLDTFKPTYQDIENGTVAQRGAELFRQLGID